jgi:hypothetical protein
MSYRLNPVPSKEQLKMLLLKKFELQATLEKLDEIISSSLPEDQEAAIQGLVIEGKIKPVINS